MSRTGLLLFPASTLGTGPTAFDWWRDEARRLGIDLRVAFLEDMRLEYGAGAHAFVGDVSVGEVDFVIMRGYDAAISLHFETLGTPVFNRWAPMALSHDKLLTHQRLTAAGIASPRTVFHSIAPSYAQAAAELGSPVFVVKQRDASRGNNVFLVDDAASYAEALRQCPGAPCLQHYVAASHGRDLRVWTVGDKAVACVLRYSDTSFLSNFSQGGKAMAHDIDPALGDIAVGAAKAVDLDFAGVDVLMGADGYTVCEVNGNAGFRTLAACKGTNIIRHYLEYIHRKVYEHR